VGRFARCVDLKQSDPSITCLGTDPSKAKTADVLSVELLSVSSSEAAVSGFGVWWYLPGFNSSRCNPVFDLRWNEPMLKLYVPKNEPVHVFDGDRLILTITRLPRSEMSFECDPNIRIVRDKVIRRDSEDIAATTSVDAMESIED
jgi:hypothetical protein